MEPIFTLKNVLTALSPYNLECLIFQYQIHKVKTKQNNHWLYCQKLLENIFSPNSVDLVLMFSYQSFCKQLSKKSVMRYPFV